MTEKPDPHAFEHVTNWIFDLDNTLYPHDTDLFSQIDIRMTNYVETLLKLPRDEARKLQKQFYLEYGTTLKGLMECHQIDPDDFLQKVHDIDYTWLKPDPALGEAIRALPGRRYIFTNGDRGHAEKAARQLGILDDFDDIFDIVAAGLTPKPEPVTYDRFLGAFNIDPTKAVMFEDLARNLVVPKNLGMKTVLVVPNNFEPTFSEIWESDPEFTDQVDFVTDNLTQFLESLIAPGAPLKTV